MKTQTKTKTLFYFTFGVGHLLDNHFIVIKAWTPQEARMAVIGQFGQRWSFQYEAGRAEAEWIDREHAAGRLAKIGPIEV